MFFRLLVFFFTVATIVLSVWSLVGSYKNATYLTNNYLLGFQLSNLNILAILTEASSKRDVIVHPVHVEAAPSKTLEARADNVASITSLLGGATSLLEGLNSGADVASLASRLTDANSGVSIPTSAIANAISTADASSVVAQVEQFASTVSIPSSLASLAADFEGDISSLLSDIVSQANVSDLGLSDFYNVGFWGYCKGNIQGNSLREITELGRFGKSFLNNHVNYTYCSKPKAGYKLDPLTLLKHEIVQKVSDYANGISSLTGGLSDSFAAQLVALASSISYENLGLPGDLKDKLTLIHNLTVAAFALILAGACLAFISLIFQMVGMCCTPNSSILSCCNFMLMLLVFIVVLVGSILSTVAYILVRHIVNDNVKQYGAKAYLSVQFYAFSWSAAAAALLFLVLSIIGYCCGCFHPRHRYTRANEIRYDHKP